MKIYPYRIWLKCSAFPSSAELPPNSLYKEQNLVEENLQGIKLEQNLDLGFYLLILAGLEPLPGKLRNQTQVKQIQVLQLNCQRANAPILLHLSLNDIDLLQQNDYAEQLQLPIFRRLKQSYLAASPLEFAPIADISSLTIEDRKTVDTEQTTACLQLAKQVAQQLHKYLHGKCKIFSLPLLLLGTPFMLKAWLQLMAIPYGQTASYQEQARSCGNERASRAIGMANHKNPLILLLPCHRVIGKNGKLTGFRPGLQHKAYFLQLEQRNLVGRV